MAVDDVALIDAEDVACDTTWTTYAQIIGEDVEHTCAQLPNHDGPCECVVCGRVKP